MKVINVSIPQSADTQVLHNPMADDIIALNFPTTNVGLSRVGDNLVFEFTSGRTAVLNGFYNVYSSENMPTFIVDDEEIPGEVFFAAMESSDLMPAAGPTASTQNADGSFYNAGGGQELMSGTGEGMEGESSFTSGLTRSFSFAGTPETNSVLLASVPSDTNVPPVSTIPPTEGGSGSDGSGGDDVDTPGVLPPLVQPSPLTYSTDTMLRDFNGKGITIQYDGEGEQYQNFKFDLEGEKAIAMRAGGGTVKKNHNIIKGGELDNVVTINASSENDDHRAHALLASADVKNSKVSNTIQLGKGKDEITMTVDDSGLLANSQAKGAVAENTVRLGDDEDEFTINADMGLNASVETSSAKAKNTVDLGDGNDSFVINAATHGMRAVDDVVGKKLLLKPVASKADVINTIDAGDGNDNVTINAGADAMRAVGNAKNVIDLGKGSDTLNIDGQLAAHDGGQNILEGGQGKDEFELNNTNGNTHNVLVATTSGKNTVNLGKGEDILSVDGKIIATDYAKNSIDLGKDNDTLTLDGQIIAREYGQNILEGGDGKDTFTFSNTDADNVLVATFGATNIIDLGKGNDTLSIDGKIVANNGGENILIGGKGEDLLTLSNTNANNAYTFKDTANGIDLNDGSATIKGFETIKLGESDDLVRATNQLDVTLDGGDGFDVVLLENGTELNLHKYNNFELIVAGDVQGKDVDAVLKKLGLDKDSFYEENYFADNGWSEGKIEKGYTEYSNGEINIWVQNPPTLRDINPLAGYFEDTNISLVGELNKPSDDSGIDEKLADTLEQYMEGLDEATDAIDMTSKTFMTEQGMTYEAGTLNLNENWEATNDGWKNIETGLEIDDAMSEIKVAMITG